MSKKGIAAERKQEDLIVRLKEAQREHGYVPEGVMAELAESMGIPLNDVYGVASFYSFLSTKPLGRNVIRVCRSMPCYLKHYEVIVGSISKELGIEPGETTADGRFSLQLTNCIGLCDMAPAMLINDDAYGDLTPQKIARILKSYK
ncbi:MAG: NADH-quinone oxidoreductase subunit NuoE [Chloroflexota bacterium]